MLLVGAVEDMTLREDLRFMTLLPWRTIVTARTASLLRGTKAYCADCYEDAREANAIVYDPLLWGFVVARCASNINVTWTTLAGTRIAEPRFLT